MQCRAVQESEELVCKLVREKQFRPCELLLLEVGSWGMGIVREPTERGSSAVGSRYQATTSEDREDWEDLVRVVVNCKVCELAKEL
jgi:hypothetical protein